jgi:sirohydrochlorin ferrochelatase
MVTRAYGAAPRLLLVAHGTASAEGAATTTRLVTAVRAARPAIDVDLCFLDVAAPRLPDALDGRATIVVPLLLSTGYHVQSDIPAATMPYATVRVARHLGPDPLLADALADRLGPLRPDEQVALVAAGSSRAEAAEEVAEAARLLAARIGRPVRPLTLADDVHAALAPGPVRVATYLLAEGQFVTSLQAAVRGLGSVAPPIGVHPALVRLVWARYDETAG